MNSNTKPIGMALPPAPDPDDVNRAARRKADRRDKLAKRAAVKRHARRVGRALGEYEDAR